MARDYKNINQTNTEANKQTGRALPFVSGLSIGLVVAGIVFIYMDARVPPPIIITEIREVEKAVPAETESSEENTDMPEPTFEFVDQKSTEQEPIEQQLDFEFYKILPNKEINISELVDEDELTTPEIESQDEHIYMLQVAAFKNRDSADTEKANLALLGMKAEIQQALIRGQDIVYRVRLGPYTSIQELKTARKMLHENEYNPIEERLQPE